MTLYGLDIMISRGKPWLCEINGIRSGMNGFKDIYGDDRVQQEVWRRLVAKHGTLTYNDGTYALAALRRRHPLRYALASFMVHVRPPKEPAWRAEVRTLGPYDVITPFDVYNGQDCSVINYVNDPLLPHKLVNPYVHEECSRSKFLQYCLLRDVLRDHILPTTLVGLGSEHPPSIDAVLADNDRFVTKPVRGFCGAGVRVLDRAEAQAYRKEPAPLNQHANLLSALASSAPDYLEDAIDRGEFDIENGLGVLQPFVDTRKKKRGDTYDCIRAIVCDGRFIDAYKRRAGTPVVNLARKARALPCIIPWLATWCEDVIRTFDEKASSLNPLTFYHDIYMAALAPRGLQTKEQRIEHARMLAMRQVVQRMEGTLHMMTRELTHVRQR